MKASLIIILLLSLMACGGNKRLGQLEAFKSGEEAEQSEINQKIADSAILSRAQPADSALYRLGAGDVLELTVFQVEDLNTKVRVNGRGEVILPLLGTVSVQGKSVADVELEIAALLEKDYLQNPQVSVFIEEYRSQQITVMGAVETPNVYSVRQSRSIFEMLSLAGGLNEEAADQIRVTTTQADSETGEPVTQNLILSVKRLLEGAETASYIKLSGGDSILVPKAGVIFVEGAVEKPGSYPIEGQAGVLKAIALAGGVPWEGNQGAVRVIRDIAGQSVAMDVNLAKVRKQTDEDVILKDGDIVVVSYSTTKRFISGFFETAGRIFGYRLD